MGKSGFDPMGIQPFPSSAALLMARGFSPPTQIDGWGIWTGFGRNFMSERSLSHRPVGELTNTGVGAMGLKRGRPVRLHRPLVGPQKGRLLS